MPSQAPNDIGSRPMRSWIMGPGAFERRMPHHDGIEALWETKWKIPCSKGVYPFHDGKYEDFEPIFEQLIKNKIDDGTTDAYTLPFLPAAESLVTRGDAAADAGRRAEAEALYLRACAVLRIARFPYLAHRAGPGAGSSSLPAVGAAKWTAWRRQKEVYALAARAWEGGRAPLEEVDVPYPAGGGNAVIPVYVRVPPAAAAAVNGAGRGRGAVPVVVLMTGLDGYRPDNTVRCEEFLSRGWAAVVVEIPGTADCPADPADPSAPEGMWDALLAWMGADGRFDMGRVMAWGLSAGGYYAVRAAHTHADAFVGVVAQGAGCHHFFGKEWLSRADGHEYPFLLTPALALKHGYSSVEEFKRGAQKKFSLLENGILDKPSTRLLLINGTHDGLMPIEDSLMLFDHGTPKEARFFPGALHMGYPMANASVYPWMESVMSSVQPSQGSSKNDHKCLG